MHIINAPALKPVIRSGSTFLLWTDLWGILQLYSNQQRVGFQQQHLIYDSIYHYPDTRTIHIHPKFYQIVKRIQQIH